DCQPVVFLSTSVSSSVFGFFVSLPPSLASSLFPYTTLFRSWSRPPTAPASATPKSPASSVPSASRLRYSPNVPWPRTGSSEPMRSEEHTSELQSRENLVCRLLLEKKNRQRELNRAQYTRTRT